MSRGAAALASLLVTLGRPAWWVLALAAFLVRGGIVAFLVPIVAIPSPLAVSNAVAPLIVPVAFGRIGPEFLALIAFLIVGLAAWLLLGGYVAAAADRALILEASEAAAEEGLGEQGSSTAAAAGVGGVVGRMLAVRLAALLPLALAIGVGALGIVEVAYAELTRPIDVATPLALRVVAGAAWQIAAIGLTWVAAEVVGGAAGRRIVMNGASAAAALSGALGDLVRRPRSSLLPWLASTAFLALLVGVVLVAGAVAWQRVRGTLADPAAEPLSIVVALLAFMGIWFAALALTGLMAAGRTVVGVFEHVRLGAHVPPDPGTFGAGAHRRPGDWSVGDGGGSL